jgi:hypothetical protein
LGEIGIGKTQAVCFFSAPNLYISPFSSSAESMSCGWVGGWVGSFFLCFYLGVLGSLFTWARLLFWFVLLIWVSPQTFTLLCNFFFRPWSRTKNTHLLLMGFGSRSPLFGNFSTLCSFTPVMGFLLVSNLGDDILLKHGFCFWKIQECEIAKKQRKKKKLYCHPISQIIISTTNVSLLSAGAIHSLHTDLLWPKKTPGLKLWVQ